MKEEKLRNLMSKVDSDTVMDHRIMDHLFYYEEDSGVNLDRNNVNRRTVIPAGKRYKFILNKGSKIAAALIFFAILGTATVWASSYFVKTHPIDLQIKPMKEYEALVEEWEAQGYKSESQIIKEQRFGEGEVGGTFLSDASGNKIEPDSNGVYKDSDGNILDSGILPEYDPVKSGDEAFAVLGLSNLTPTYVFDNNYILSTEGYRYTETEHKIYAENKSDCFIEQSITAFFDDTNKTVHFTYTPIDDAASIGTSYFVQDEADVLNSTTSTYVTEGGLLCNLVITDDEYEAVTAEIYLESETLGKVLYSLSFNHVEMDEIEAILDSVPISTTEDIEVSDTEE